MAPRIRNLFNENDSKPFLVSRSKIELFVQCPRCFYLDRKLGIGRPSTPPFTLNSAVDMLLKAEFDVYREKSEAHPLMTHFGIDAVPFPHKDLSLWRENFKGVRFHHPKSNLLISGAVDDLWVNKEGEVFVVDYKATSKDETPTLDSEWQKSYKRQMEIYQWLLRSNGLNVSNTGYFVYANGNKHESGLHGALHFDLVIIPYVGDAAWIEKTLQDITACLCGSLPQKGVVCEYCTYRSDTSKIETQDDASNDSSYVIN